MISRRIIIGVGIIVSFALLIATISLYYVFQHEDQQSTRLSAGDIDSMDTEEIKSFIESRRAEQPVLHSYYLLPFIGFIGILVGTLVYYVMSDQIAQKDLSIKKNTRIILNFLRSQERKVVDLLLENEGRMQQYELSHLPGLNKVRTHRILVNLENKGVVRKERFGKINRISLDKELYDVLKE